MPRKTAPGTNPRLSLPRRSRAKDQEVNDQKPRSCHHPLRRPAKPHRPTSGGRRRPRVPDRRRREIVPARRNGASCRRPCRSIPAPDAASLEVSWTNSLGRRMRHACPPSPLGPRCGTWNGLRDILRKSSWDRVHLWTAVGGRVPQARQETGISDLSPRSPRACARPRYEDRTSMVLVHGHQATLLRPRPIAARRLYPHYWCPLRAFPYPDPSYHRAPSPSAPSPRPLD